MPAEEDFKIAQQRILEAKNNEATVLDLGDLELEELPDEIGELEQLKYLSLGHCKYEVDGNGLLVKNYPDDRWKIRKPITNLNPLSALSALQSLDLGHCESVTDLQPLVSLTALQSLDLVWCQSLTDLQPLASLTTLQSLDLTGCESIIDLQPLASLSTLQSLDLNDCNAITNLQPLASLTTLQSLGLSGCESIISLQPLISLTALQSLDLSGCESIIDLQPLASLSTLQSLDLSECNTISGLQFIVSLTALKSLNLTSYYMISDLQPLASLTTLQSLDLSYCDAITDLQPLTSLTTLQSLDLSYCDAITDLQPLASLDALQSLNLSSCHSITNLQPLASFSALQSLNLRRCKSIIDLQPLASLSTLKSLDLSVCTSIHLFTPILTLLYHLKNLVLWGCSFTDLPKEACGPYWADNVISNVRAYYADLAFGQSMHSEMKLFVLGNGGVGKTQLSRRLQNKAYDPQIESTHGIQIAPVSINTYNAEPTNSVQLNLWDFGGQDIYHGSHTLFIQGQALFIVMWSPEKEMGNYEDGGTLIHHRPLSYWLDYIRNLTGPEITLLVVQGHCDQPSRQQRPNIPTDDFRYCQLLNISPKTGFGLNTLRGHIEDAVHAELEQRPTIPIGQGRVEVRDQLHEMLDKDQQLPSNERQHRTLSIEVFEHICRENGKISDASAFLDYLHHCGDIFYREGLFDNQIILDQAWALDAIYTLFHREHALPALNRYGRFTREELALLIWKDYSIAEQQLFLSFMESCGICFKVKQLNSEEYDSEWEYIAPELLPQEADIQSSLAGRMIGQNSETLHAEYDFLHEGILRNLLTKIGQQANDNAVYWKYGCWFFENNTQSQIRIQSQVDTNSGQGQITFTAMGPESCQLIVKVLRLLQEIRVGQTPTLTGTWFNGTRTLNDIHQMNKDTYTNHSSHQEHNAKLNVTEHPNIESTGKPEIYISYAWGEDRTNMGRQREAAVEGIATVAEECGFNVRLDRRDLRLGDWISNYMKAITNSDRVIVILSEKFLQSEACMTELHGIYQRAVGEKQTFLDRIISVVLDDAKNIGKLEYRVSCAKAWKQRFEKLEPDLDVIGHDGYRLWQQMRLWYTDTADMLGFISDTLHPHGFEDLTKDNYHGIRELLTRKLADGKQHKA